MNRIFSEQASSRQAVGVQLSAATADTLKYLGEQAGKVIEARVVQALAAHTSPTTTPASQQSAAATINATVADEKHTHNTQAQNNPASATNTSNKNDQYLVKLDVGGRQIQVTASQLPRIGQQLLLEVVDYKTLTILNANEKSASPLAFCNVALLVFFHGSLRR